MNTNFKITDTLSLFYLFFLTLISFSLLIDTLKRKSRRKTEGARMREGMSVPGQVGPAGQ